MKALIGLKKFIRKLIRLTGFTISPYNSYEASLNEVKYNWLKEKNIKTIIDVGACDGDFIRKFRPIFPEATIYSFEPNPEAFTKLNILFKTDKKLKTFNLALSNTKGEIDFFVSENAGSSSLLVMDELHKINIPHSAMNHLIKVNCDLMDNVFSSIELEKNVLLKLDVQGAEKLVIEGAIKTLSKVDIIYTEINFQELYKNSILVNDLINLLNKHNFRLVGIENIHQSIIDGSFMHGDAVFIKEKKSV